MISKLLTFVETLHGREAYARREASPLGQRYPLGNPLGQRLY
ncbi:MAG: hypothetical protein QNJ55_13295 [Xenococcus sp. MO_188.B8]|nr:hypothetical protein [Xenococcus sp. MO_188.B8]